VLLTSRADSGDDDAGAPRVRPSPRVLAVLSGASSGRQVLLWSGATLASAWLATAPRVNARELRLFRLFNQLPPQLELPVWLVMQAGSLPAVPAGAGAALVAREPQLAADLALAGGLSWAAAKGAKRVIRRERPAVFVAELLLRGRPQAGLGFPSGHAAVAAALATAVTPRIPAVGRRAVWGSVVGVAIARMYVGAHLPVDVLGGVALGSAISSGVRLWRRKPRRLPRTLDSPGSENLEYEEVGTG
jgi:glycosyltransferase 2 family protein